jgi:hypothetical protein
MGSEPPPYYAAPSGRPSQGDIVDNVCFGMLHDPVTYCRAYPDENGTSGNARFRPVAEQSPAPGARAPFGNGKERVHLSAKRGLVMVAWEDCMIDKFMNQQPPPPEAEWFCAVAPVRSCAALPEAARTSIMNGEQRRFFPLKADPSMGIATDSYADLRLLFPVQQSLLSDRKGGLSETSRRALQAHLFRFFTGTRVVTVPVACPHCGSAVETLGTQPEAEPAPG